MSAPVSGPIAGTVLAASGSDLVQNLVAGLALGSKYALIALGFVVVFRSTGAINFAQGSFVLVGAYLTYHFSQTWGVNFYLSIVLAMGCGALLGMLIEATVLKRLVGEAVFTVIMVTIGLLFVIDTVVEVIWGSSPLLLGDPWRGNVWRVGDVIVTHTDLWSMALTAVALVTFLAVFRYTSLGLAMRATALDQEAALAQGISARRVYRAAWAIAGMVGALGGAMLATGRLEPTLGLVALAAFPAMILGGMDSPLGAVVGGLTIGVVQQMSALLLTEQNAPFLGRSFEQVAPYAVMVVILLIRPYGLFGTKEVRRV